MKLERCATFWWFPSLTNFRRSFRSFGSSVVLLKLVAAVDVTVAVGRFDIDVEFSFGAGRSADGDTGRGGDVKLFGTILNFFFFGRLLSDWLGGDSKYLLGLKFSSEPRFRLWIVTWEESFVDMLLKSMLWTGTNWNHFESCLLSIRLFIPTHLNCLIQAAKQIDFFWRKRRSHRVFVHIQAKCFVCFWQMIQVIFGVFHFLLGFVREFVLWCWCGRTVKGRFRISAHVFNTKWLQSGLWKLR